MGLTKPRAGQINFDAHNVTDPLIRINSGQSGTNDKDVGFVFERGSDTNVALFWDESADQLVLVNTTEDGTTSGNVTISSYADIRANAYYGDGSNLTGVSSTSTLAALTDTTISNPQDDHFLRYNGSAWINEAVTLTSTVSALTDTTISSPSSGQVLKYNGSAWINDADSATTTVTLSEMTGDGSDTTLTLEATPSSDDNLLVFVDSVLQDAGAWSRSGTTLTFSEAPASGAVVKAWDLLSSTATNAAKLDALTADGSTTAFTLQQGGSTYTPSHQNCLLVSVAGVLQEPGSGKAFTVSGSTITFSAAPATGATIWIVDVGGGVTVNTPADDSVTSAKIVDGTITNDDINASAAIAQSKLANVPHYTSSGTAPSSPTAGDYWYDSSTNIAKIYNGTDWKALFLPALTVDYLVIAGGGSGGRVRSGGGGAGGYRNSYNSESSGGGGSSETTLTLIANNTYTVTVGAGGGAISSNSRGNDGSNSVFATITSTGGGGGGADIDPPGRSGGSGGGAGENSGGPYSGGAGTSNQGYAGGTTGGTTYTSYPGAGGGGAGQVGGNVVANATGGDGGDGLASSITGASVTRGGGGGGAPQSGTGGTGGAGGGADGASAAQNNGTANTGGGGGARGENGGTTGAGGSGVVIVRYPSAFTITVSAGLTSSTSIDGSDKVTTFTAGTDTVSWS